jgi:protein-histidine N-methyltransferase
MEQPEDLGADLTKNNHSIAVAASHHDQKHLCLVAAKVIYFGVGGGVAEFSRFVEDAAYLDHDRGHHKGVVETVWERRVGVERQVLRIKWESL